MNAPTHRLRNAQLALIVSLIAHPALAQNVDFDNAMQQFGTVAFGPGARILVVIIASYLAFWGLSHQHLWVSLTGILGAVAYFSVGVFLGRIGIA